MGWNRRRFVAASLISSAVPMAAWAKQTDAALWEVRQGGAKVYLFGDGGPLRTQWRSARIEAALHESAVMWKEVPANGGLTSALMVFAAGIDLFAPLSTWLTQKDLDRVAAAATTSGIAYVRLEFFKPWFAAEFLRDSFYQRNGFKDENSADAALPALAIGARKPIHTEFPDMSAVIAYGSGFSNAASVQSLLTVVDDIEAGPHAVERFDKAWAEGNESLAIQEVARWKRLYPEFYKEAIVARNRRWPARIRTILSGGGTTFVLVGGDHLAGPDSIQNQLAAAGMTARRI